MKPILKAFGLLVLLVIQTTIFAQTAAQKRVIVYFKTGVQRNPPPNQNTVTITSANVTQVLNNYGLTSDSVRSSFPDFNEADTVIAEIGEGSRQMDYARVFTISLPDTSFKSSLLNALQNLSEVLYAESDGDVTTNLIPVDGRFGDQWNMRNLVVPGADIHAEAAWDIFTGNPNSIIAIIDNGVDVNHNDLAAKIDGGDNTFTVLHDPVAGDYSHGSHVAGIVAAVTNNNNNNGVAGVDWQARIHPLNVINVNSGDPQITEAINNSINFSPNVWTFNNSWGSSPVGRYSVTVRSAFANAYRNNRVSCIAMGNHQITNPNVPAFPADINSGVIAVGATDDHDQIANFSAQGPHIDVSAPGVNITSTNFNNGYIALSGTSMATPHVSGLASLLKGFNTNLANDDIEQIIRLTADDVNSATLPGFDNEMGTGRINAQRALQSLQAPNTLQHLNTTGGTIFSTTANETRIFLGVPGLSDAAYVVKRSEVRTNIIIPAMCSTIGVWGRGIGTTGYREEQGRSFGEGICEIVPGTLTNTSATLRTWIYEVWSINGQYLGFYPANAQNVIFQYTVLGVPAPTTIAGDNIFCNTPSNNYTIPNLPSGASVNWSVTPGGIATPNTPILPQTTLNKNGDGVITLNAIISCGASITIIKPNISVGKPQPGPIAFPLIDPALGKIQAQVDPVPGATSYNWYKNGVLQTIGHGSFIQFPITRNLCNVYYDISVEAINSCGTSLQTHAEAYVPPCNNAFAVSPNPASASINVAPAAGNAQLSASTTIDEIRIYDLQGNLKKYQKFNKATSATMNIQGLIKGSYFVEIISGTIKERHQMVIQN